MQPADGAYLVRLTMANTGLAQPDAERRVNEVAPKQRKIYPARPWRADAADRAARRNRTHQPAG
jgi:hypothetical protein